MDPNNLQIIKYIIKSSPIGHLKETIECLKNILGSQVLEEPEIKHEILGYEEEHFKHISLNEDKILISNYTKDQDGYYHDQSKKLKISVVPLSENIEKIIEDEENQSSLRNSLNKLLLDYKDKNFKPSICATNSK